MFGRCHYGNAAESTGCRHQIDGNYGVLMIDLTVAFGAGNEPTIDWCDENIQYFDGSKNIVQALSKLTYDEANSIETLLLEIETHINNMIAAFNYCGTLFSGEGVILS